MSDIWSLGLSLIEMAVGRYPIPPPSTEDIEHLFKEDPHGNRPRLEGKLKRNVHRTHSRCELGFGYYKGLAIFELMEYIINEPSPTLPRTYFSAEFCDFIDRW